MPKKKKNKIFVESGRKGGSSTKKRGPDYYKEIAAIRWKKQKGKEAALKTFGFKNTNDLEKMRKELRNKKS